ncbi:MAG: zinc ribbon domain-containing protein [Lysobacterales bacterium]
MPIYEYRCESCEHRLEKLQKMSEGVLVDCPACKRPTLKRLVSAPAFRLSGTGWYETDFKKDNKRNLAEATTENTSSKASADGDSKKTDTKAAASGAVKTEAKPAAKSDGKE